MLRPVLNLLLLTGFLVAAAAWWFPQVWACSTVRFRGFNEAAPAVFMSLNIPERHHPLLLKRLRLASGRVRQLWGGQQGRPVVICCGSQAEYERFCPLHEGAGCSLSTPVGAWVVLHPAGLGADVMAHELAHAELAARLSWRAAGRVPQWFDEGLALQLDERFGPYAATAGASGFPAKLNDLSTLEGFFGKEGRKPPGALAAAYGRSGREVARWYAVAGPGGLRALAEQLRQGRAFAEAYTAVFPSAKKSL